MKQPRLRASDAQRTAVWEVIDAAFADGKLDHFEHFERTRAASRAKFVDELRPLITDLRGGDADLDLGVDTSPTARHHSDLGRGESERKSSTGTVIAISLVVLAVLGGAVAAMASDDSPLGTSTSEHSDSGPGPLHTTEGLERVISSAQTELAGLDLDSLGIHRNSASAMYEDPGEPGKRLSYAFRGGEWEQSGFHARTESSTFRIEDVDAGVIAAAIEAAPGELEMSGAELSHVTVFADALGDPEYAVSLKDGSDFGTATFGPEGEIRKTN